jgi:hypothetical protein
MVPRVVAVAVMVIFAEAPGASVYRFAGALVTTNDGDDDVTDVTVSGAVPEFVITPLSVVDFECPTGISPMLCDAIEISSSAAGIISSITFTRAEVVFTAPHPLRMMA